VNYYNEIDSKAAAWLRELMRSKVISSGVVDETSIAEVNLNELAQYTQCHFFAGIGGWSYALRLAGWPDDKPVWTGSCPCQPFSDAGKGQVDKDKRHLWPAFRAAIAKCRPSTCFGEQVASKDGRILLAGVRSDLEALGYGVGAADLCAAGVGAPHRRQRLFWMAHADGRESSNGKLQRSGQHRQWSQDGSLSGLADSTQHGRKMRDPEDRELRRQGLSEGCAIGDWVRCDIIVCLDGKSRRIEPGSFPLANGIPNRVGLLRGYGNAIVPQLASEFIQAACESVR